MSFKNQHNQERKQTKYLKKNRRDLFPLISLHINWRPNTEVTLNQSFLRLVACLGCFLIKVETYQDCHLIMLFSKFVMSKNVVSKNIPFQELPLFQFIQWSYI